MLYKSESIDQTYQTYLSLEIEDGHGVLYEIFDKGDVYEMSYICDVYTDVIRDGVYIPCYDGKLDWFQLEFLKSIFPNIKRI